MGISNHGRVKERDGEQGFDMNVGNTKKKVCHSQKRVKIVYQGKKMVKGEGLQILAKKAKAQDLEKNTYYMSL